MRAIERAGPVLEHLHQPRLVEGRIGVGRAGEAGDTAGDRRSHLRVQRRLVFEARLAQPRRNIDQPGADDEPRRVEHAVGMPSGGSVPQRGHLAGGDVERRLAIGSVLRVDHAPVFDLDLHPRDISFPQGCSSRPCAPRYRRSPAAGSPNACRRPPRNRSRPRGSSVPGASRSRRAWRVSICPASARSA